MSASAGPDPHHASASAGPPPAPPAGSGDRQDITGSFVGRDANQIGSARDVAIGDQHHHHHLLSARVPLPDAAKVDAPLGLTGLPRPATAVFVGREQVLRQMRDVLTATPSARTVITQAAAVHGLGGVGKSELALQYAAAHRQEYRLVWWVEADTPAQIEASLADVARALCAGAHSVAAAQATIEEAAGWAMAWLSGHTGWLLIFDNVEHADDVRRYLGRLAGGHVLITTRRAGGWSALGCAAIDVDVLAPAAATELLAGLIGPDIRAEEEDLAGLAEDLGFLPLALRQAGAFIAATPGMSITDYRTLLLEEPGEVYAAAAPGSDAERVIAKIWTITCAQIAEASPLAPRLLALLACYAPDDLPITVLHQLPDTSKLRIGTALGVLASYSMIAISPGRDAVSVHRLVQAVTLTSLTDDQRHAVRLQAADLLTAALPDNPEVIDSWPAYRQLLPHARAALPPLSPAMDEVLVYLKASDDYTTAKTLHQHRHHFHLQRHGPEHPRTLNEHAQQAHCTGQTGDATSARDQFAALLPVIERVLGADHPDTLFARHNLARWTGQAGNAASGRDQFAELLPVIERVLGADHPYTLTTRNNLAFYSGEAGDAAGARDQFAALLPIGRRLQGADHPNTLTTRHNLARWTGDAGDAESARGQFAALLPTLERVLGIEHPGTLIARSNLARWTGETGDAAGARTQFAELLPIRERVLGAEHPTTLTARAHLARWTGEAGDAAGARDQFAALLPIHERVLGAEHPHTLATRKNLAYWTRRCQEADADSQTGDVR
ncbi:FxSxx-COOH system tetratricopeptide repeat protein [Herbidospora mongoliensis]|uniref:FxSxx-COOH system tetratricopeptide repeat protein n=1 Tax=Herbidospora mongoliensis TaxID=688067 RepID=UPI00082C60CE|nr:FxSxx-COOH system tetratricopeptide repeat protein [Herbidospora mongoliensis]